MTIYFTVREVSQMSVSVKVTGIGYGESMPVYEEETKIPD